jgi:hypothetical protein
MRRGAIVLAATAGAILTLAFGPAAAATLIGTWDFERDKGGSGPAAGATVTLTFDTDGTATLLARKPGLEIEDIGTFKIEGKRVTLLLPKVGKYFKRKGYKLDDPLLTLPFRLFSADAGESVWRRSEPLSLAPFAASGPPAPRGLAARIKAAAGAAKVSKGSGGSSTGGMGTAPPPPAPTGAGPYAHLAGRWVGEGVGAETRFRKGGTLTIVAKHVTDFWFDLNAMGVIHGRGEVRYALDVDRKGPGPEARSVASFVEAWLAGGKGPAASMVRADAGLSEKIVRRSFEIRGYVDSARNEIILEVVGDLGKLSYTYRSGGRPVVRPFPAWSPFLPASGGKVNVSRSSYEAAFEKSGTGRKRPWQEFWFTWKARKKS